MICNELYDSIESPEIIKEFKIIGHCNILDGNVTEKYCRYKCKKKPKLKPKKGRMDYYLEKK